MPCQSSTKITQGDAKKQYINLSDFGVGKKSINLNFLIYRICDPRQTFSFS